MKNNQFYNQIYNIYKNYYENKKEFKDKDGNIVGKIIEYNHDIFGVEYVKVKNKFGDIVVMKTNELI
jgi:hypothetical protein